MIDHCIFPAFTSESPFKILISEITKKIEIPVLSFTLLFAPANASIQPARTSPIDNARFAKLFQHKR